MGARQDSTKFMIKNLGRKLSNTDNRAHRPPTERGFEAWSKEVNKATNPGKTVCLTNNVGKRKMKKKKTETKSEEETKEKKKKKRGNKLGTSSATCEMASKHEQPVAATHHYSSTRPTNTWLIIRAPVLR